VTRTVYAYILLPALILCLFKSKPHVCTWRWLKMGWVHKLPLPTVWPRLCNKYPFSALGIAIYSVYWGRWSNLTYESSGVSAWGPKPQFQRWHLSKRDHQGSWVQGQAQSLPQTSPWGREKAKYSSFSSPLFSDLPVSSTGQSQVVANWTVMHLWDSDTQRTEK
jgi:hypothetical protein